MSVETGEPEGYVPQRIGLVNQEVKIAKAMAERGDSILDIAMHFSVPVDVILEFSINNWYITGINLPSDHQWITAEEYRKTNKATED